MPRPTPETTRIRCGGPGDALDAIPWMLGFAPTESFVLLGLSGPRSRLGPALRFDLLDPALDEAVAAEALQLVQQRTSCDQVLLVVYTDRGSTDPLSPLPRQQLLLEARRQFTAAGIHLRDAVTVRHGRWWSMLCDNPLCCPPEGTPTGRGSPSAVELAYRSTGAFPPAASREAVAESLRRQPSEAVDVELRRLGSAARGLQPDTLTTQLHEVVAHAMACPRGALDPAVIALLIFLVQTVVVRDRAVEAPSAEELTGAVALWREVYVACPDSHRPHVGAVLAMLAWEAGAGGLATCTCESVLEIEPEHRLTRLTATLLARGVRPEPRPGRRGPP